jgi:hypothetical protein
MYARTNHMRIDLETDQSSEPCIIRVLYQEQRVGVSVSKVEVLGKVSSFLLVVEHVALQHRLQQLHVPRFTSHSRKLPEPLLPKSLDSILTRECMEGNCPFNSKPHTLCISQKILVKLGLQLLPKNTNRLSQELLMTV